MVRLEEDIVVNQPIVEVFHYLSDFTTSAQWDPGIASAEQMTPGEIKEGTSFELVASFWGSQVPMTYTIQELDSPHRIVLKGTGEHIEALDIITLTQVGEGTLINYVAEISLQGVASMFEFLMKPLLVRMGQKTKSGIQSALQSPTFFSQAA